MSDFSEKDLIDAQLLMLQIAEDYDACEASLSRFIKSAWHALEPGVTYCHNWHIDLISEYLEAVTNQEIKKLIINMPYRHMKSIAVSVCWPVWWWIRDPTRQFMFASYSDRLSNKHSRDRRFLIESKWYQDAWSKGFSLLRGDNQIEKFRMCERSLTRPFDRSDSWIGMRPERVIFTPVAVKLPVAGVPGGAPGKTGAMLAVPVARI